MVGTDPRTPPALKEGLRTPPSPKPIVFLGLIAVIPTSDDLPGETLEVVGAFAIRGVLHGLLRLELL